MTPETRARIKQMTERGEVRQALFALLAEWETQITSERDHLLYAPLADKADAFIDAMAGYVESRRTADSPEWSRQFASRWDDGPYGKPLCVHGFIADGRACTQGACTEIPALLAAHRAQGKSGKIDHAFTPVLNRADFPDCVYDIAPGYICGYPESAHKSDHAAPGPGDGK